MNPIVRVALIDARNLLMAGHVQPALDALQYARRNLTPGIGQGRAWSKIMLAIRHLSRIAPTADRTS